MLSNLRLSRRAAVSLWGCELVSLAFGAGSSHDRRLRLRFCGYDHRMRISSFSKACRSFHTYLIVHILQHGWLSGSARQCSLS